MSDQSSCFLQQVSEDSSLEYSADWDTFSFEDDLTTRKNITKEHFQIFKLYKEPIETNNNGEDVILQSQEYKNVYCELLERNEILLSKYDALVNEHKRIEEEVGNLKLKNKSLEKSIKDHEEEEVSLRKDYKLQKVALQKGVEMYTTHFDLDIDINNISDTMYEALIKFGKAIDSAPIKLTVDRTKRKVIAFNVNGVLTPEEEEDIRKRFGDLRNIPGLLCVLRNIVVNKQASIN